MHACIPHSVGAGGETAAATADAAAAGGTLDTCSGTEEFTVTGGVDPSFDGCYEVAEAYLSDYNTFSLGGVVADGPIFYVGDIDGDGSVSLYTICRWTLSNY